MARRRLNYKFLILLAIPFVMMGTLFALWKFVPQFKWLYRGTPAQHAAQAKALYDQGKYYEAGENYKRAIQLRGTPTADMYTALGDCYSHQALKDNENLRAAKLFYEQALSVDPTYLLAQRRLLDLYVDNVEMSRGSSVGQLWGDVEEVAKKVVALDPNDKDARLTQYRAVIYRWVSGVEADQLRIDDAIDNLSRLSLEPPFNAEAVWYLIQAKMNKAQERLRQNDRPGSMQLCEETKKLLDDALEAHPENALLHYRAAAAYRLLGLAERGPNQAPKYLDRYAAELQKGADLVKPEDDNYVEIKLAWARQLEAQGDADGAEKLYRAMISERPGDMGTRLLLSELLGRKPDPASHAEAISLLENFPPADDRKVFGLEALQFHRYEYAALASALGLKLDAMTSATTPDEYNTQIKQIDEGYAKLLSEAGESALTLHIRGRIELAKGQNIQAVQTLDRALKLAGSGGGDLEQQYKIMFALARANILVGQTNEAKKWLIVIVRDIPRFVPARVMLVQLLLREKDFDAAKEHLDVLEKAMPDSQVVVRLKMLTLDKDKDKDALNALYARIPETNPDESIDKAQMAIYLARKDEAARLLESVRQARPDNVDILASLSRLYSELGDKKKAMALIDEAIQKAPEHQALKVLRAQIEGSDVTAITKDLIDAEKDPFRKAMMAFNLAMQEDRTEDALARLKEADKIKPGDGSVMSFLFQFALASKDWDQASQLMEKLAAMDQDNAKGLLFRVRFALAQNKLDAASDLAQQLTQKLPEFAQSWVVLAQVQAAQGNYADAMQSFLQALNRQAQNLDAIRGLIGCAYALNQPSTAHRYIDQGRKLFPRNPTLRELELDYELRFGDAEKVIAPREEMLKRSIETKDPGEARAWLMLGNTYLTVARTKPNSNVKGMLEKARDTFSGAMQKWPDEYRFVQLYAETQRQLRNPAEAEKAIQALCARPAWQKEPAPTVLLADFYGKSGRPADQEKVLRDFLAANPTAIMVQEKLAVLVAGQNKLDDALKLLEPNADDAEIRKLRIELQINGGRLSAAEQEINSVLASTPNPGPVLLNRQAFVFMNSGRATQALDVLEKILATDPRNSEALYYRASIYVRANRKLDQAIKDLKTVRDSQTPEQQQADISPRLMLAEAYVRLDDPESAARELEQTSSLRPDDKQPKLQLYMIYANPRNPRWTQAERVLKDARANPQLANDLDLILAECDMWRTRKDVDKAMDSIQQAQKLAPADVRVVRGYCEVLLQAKKYKELLAVTETAVQQKQAPFWTYQYRGRARKGLDDKQKALEEWYAGFDVAAAAKDDQATESVIKTIVDEIGAKPAISRVITRAESGDNRWRLLVAYLYQVDGDIPSAINWVEKVMGDNSKADAAQLETAQRMAGAFYLQLDPPDPAKAAAVYRALLEKRSNDPTALNNLACTMILPGSGFTPKDALEYSGKAFDVLRNAGMSNPYISDTHGYVLVLNGRIDEGIALIREAIDGEAIPDAYYHLGEAYLSMSPPVPDQAESALKQALVLINKASGGSTPLDSALKAKVEKDLERCRQPAPATAP